MNTTQQAVTGAPQADDYSREDFFKVIVQHYLSFTFEQIDRNDPPIKDDPDTAQLLDALAEICPDFPRGDAVGKMLYMFAAGFTAGLEAGLTITTPDQPAK